MPSRGPSNGGSSFKVTLGLDIRITSLIIGGIVVLYTTTGGVKAVNYTDVFQLLVIMGGMALAFIVVVWMLPGEVSFMDALRLAGASGRLNAVDFSLDPQNRYNLWSGLIGGMFVAMAYFGTDQSQVQRYLTGASVAQSRLALLLNGLVKVPMQFFILLLGVMVFVFFLFHQPPLHFNPAVLERAAEAGSAGEFGRLQEAHTQAFVAQEHSVWDFLAAQKAGNPSQLAAAKEGMVIARGEMETARAGAASLASQADPQLDPSDTNYIFLSFVRKYLPAGLVGLIFACIFAASMSSSSGELSALATISVVDIYRRFIRREATDRHYLRVSRLMMAFWGIYGIAFAQYASRLGSLVEAVNILGSLFYGTMLGVFLIAFYFRSVGGTATFVGALAGELVVVYCFACTTIAWLWYNVIGCAVVLGVALFITALGNARPSRA